MQSVGRTLSRVVAGAAPTPNIPSVPNIDNMPDFCAVAMQHMRWTKLYKNKLDNASPARRGLDRGSEHDAQGILHPLIFNLVSTTRRGYSIP